MLKEVRQKLILDKITKSSKVLSSELSKDLDVSEDTIRRDLRDLSDKGLIQKVHGGAILNDSYIPMKYDDRGSFASTEKRIIAQKAVSLLKEGMVILIDGGTTNLEIIKQIPAGLRFTVITNCFPIASELVNNKDIQTYFLGGDVLSSVPITVGADTVSLLDEIRADIFFIGTRSISVDNGLTDIDRAEVLVKRKMAEKSSIVVSVALSEKLDSVQSFKIIPSEDLNILVTELNPTDSLFNGFRSLKNLIIM